MLTRSKIAEQIEVEVAITTSKDVDTKSRFELLSQIDGTREQLIIIQGLEGEGDGNSVRK